MPLHPDSSPQNTREPAHKRHGTPHDRDGYSPGIEKKPGRSSFTKFDRHGSMKSGRIL